MARKMRGDEPFITTDTLRRVLKELLENPDMFLLEAAERFYEKNPDLFEEFVQYVGKKRSKTERSVAVLLVYVLMAEQHAEDNKV